VSWPTVPAAELMLKRGGSVNPANYPDETFELLSIPAFDRGEPEIVKGKAIGSSKSCVQPNDVLLSKIVPHIKRCWVVPAPQGTYRQIGSGEWIIFRSGKVHPPFLRHFLTSDIFHKKFMNTTAGVGGSLVRARPTEVGNIEIPLPSLPEQKRIAAILDKADAIRRKRQQAIQLADDFLRAVFLDTFGDPVTNPKGLDITSIGELCDVVTGATPLRGGDEYYGGDIPWVKTGEVDGYVIYKTEENITHKALSSSNCKLNPVGSIVLAMYGQGKTRGKVGILGVEAATNQACAVIKPSSKIMMEYLYFYLQISYEALRSLGQGAGQPNLNLSIVKGFPVPLPSEIDQMRFVKVCQSVGRFKKISFAVARDSSEFFSALSQKAFSGQL